ncbi:MAG: glycoside hydrolase family 2 TIM barrel-domain containing protein [Pseudomonadales bacterium]
MLSTKHSHFIFCSKAVRSFQAVFLALFFTACSPASVNSKQAVGLPSLEGESSVVMEIKRTAEAYTLLRDGEPYRIKGAGMGLTDLAAIPQLEALKNAGGNSFRTWNIPDRKVLDRAHELGLTVALGLDVQRERHGFDYNDPDVVQQQFERIKKEVLAYRDHPAIIAWFIGNELNLNLKNPKVYDAVNDIAVFIKEVDPNRLVSSTTAGIDAELAKMIQQRAPALDFLSIQVYGGIFDLQEALGEIDWIFPLMVTEWGTKGHWEVDATTWGAPLEFNSSEKSDHYLRAYEQVLTQMNDRLIGDYAFLWGQKQERTPTWYGMLTEQDEPTAVVDVMYKIWNGHWPEQTAPKVKQLLLNKVLAQSSLSIEVGQTVEARLELSDAEPDIQFEWLLKQESTATQSGGDAEDLPADLTVTQRFANQPSVTVTAPDQPGAYRLLVYARNKTGQVAHANFPFKVVCGSVSSCQTPSE